MKQTRFRRIWHGAYYGVVPKAGVHFALKCKDVAAAIDMGEKPAGHLGRLRYWLHLSLCKVCKNYLDLSVALRQAARSYSRQAVPPADARTLNKELLDKYAKN